ncbi:transporter substrate-binding domain-containing protein [Campylobacter sp. RM9344]|uniref:Transporter substrate-binding domain-containing protein n=1 Tax=Campylobacter californiensis TaxID=1032243 RepID=A0AAW3ZUR2_9BACT|nr:MULTISPECIES: transporter substrate-binding domain-containing protein [unclassified Campylobacter]MBE2984760.1 transporter substrate-binding domain-containing protein [Campylobacter sp. RM6883]MBE2986950.1 transporter substrate-binding domain-containing protein [Campylobacter sp. RM12919]MBE2987762.1 transporter substrate-binding domain-containing protein [Campylobacter sp. RM12920]MBE2994676.1 transporter substrate-binding domain-containing protein [Campylobacter sp. RM6913]MBE3030206.1 tr
MRKFLALVAVGLLGVLNAQTLKVGMSMDYPPFEFINDQAKPSGFDVELIEAISKKIGVEVTLHNISFDGLIPALKAGKINAVMSAMSATDDRRKSVDFTDSYYATENLFIRKKGSDINENNIKGKKIGVQLGTVQEAAANMIEGAKVVPSDNILGAIMGLKVGKVDIVLVDSSIGYGYLKQNSDLEEFLKLPDGSEGFSIAFDKGKQTEIIGKINKALEELKADGTFDAIAKKYDLQ